MSGKVIERRRGRWLRTPGMAEKYPTALAGSKQLRKMSDQLPKNAEDGYPRQVRCAQCGFPIADHAAVQRCPHCTSDNILGRNLGTK